MGKLNLHCYSLVPKNHKWIPYFQFEIFCRSWFKFLIGNFTRLLIRIFFSDWEPESLKQFGIHKYFSGNWWNSWKKKSALVTKYLHWRNFFNWVKICQENKKPTIDYLNHRQYFDFTIHYPIKFIGNRLRKINI